MYNSQVSTALCAQACLACPLRSSASPCTGAAPINAPPRLCFA